MIEDLKDLIDDLKSGGCDETDDSADYADLAAVDTPAEEQN